MAIDLALTIMSHNVGTLDHLKSILTEVDSSRMFNIHYREIDYASGWAEFIRAAIYGGNLDVSEMGTTWISDFAAMNAVRPFSPTEIRNLGGEEAFPPSLWRSGVSEYGVVWAIPLMTDLRLIYYRRDLLRKAGVEEATAFSTPEKFEQTLASLAKAKIACPWVVPTRQSHMTLHNIAMWLWSKGADFVDPAGKQMALNEANARAALRSYFDLYRYLAPEARWLAEGESENIFAQGDAAVTLSGPWLYSICQTDRGQEYGMAIPFGRAYIGGSSLIIWKSSRSVLEASRLVSWLTSPGAQSTYPKAAGMLPARLDVLDKFSFSNDADINRVVIEALKGGRPLPHVPLWGMIEERLVKIASNLWEKLFSAPDADVDKLLDATLASDVQRLNMSLAG